MTKRKYLVKKVADEGEDVTVDAKRFDAALQRLLKSEPIPNAKIAGKRAVRKMDNSTFEPDK